MFEIRNDPRKENRDFIHCFILFEFDFPSEIYNHHTLMQEERRGDKSFFIFSRRIPNIFSTKAASCCLKSKAGYFALTCCTTSIALPERLLDERELCETPLYFIFEINVIICNYWMSRNSAKHQMDFLDFIYQFIHILLSFYFIWPLLLMMFRHYKVKCI